MSEEWGVLPTEQAHRDSAGTYPNRRSPGPPVMTEAEILIKAVDRAVANGWLGIRDSGYRFDGVILRQATVRINASLLDRKTWLFNHYSHVLFSEDFAEAFFGSDRHQWVALVHCTCCRVDYDATDTDCCWQYHLDQLLLAPQPLRYLEAFF